MKKLSILFCFLLIAGYLVAQPSSAKQDNVQASKLMETMINTTRGPGCNFLVLADNLPWGSNAVVNILTANGETFSTATSVTFPSLNFNDYDVIIVLSDQGPGFHTVFAANFAKFVAFVNAGGRLQVHAATCGWNSPGCNSVQLPGGIYTTYQFDYYNNIAMPAHPIVAGVSNPFYGSYASHGFFSNLQPGTSIITTTTSNGLPTTIQYNYGAGTVTATTCTYEFGYNYGQEAGEMLVNNLNYSCSGYVPPVPVSNWALYLGIFLIFTFIVIRFRRLV